MIKVSLSCKSFLINKSQFMRKIIFLDEAVESLTPRVDINPRDGLTVLRGDPKFNKDLHRWATYEVEAGKKEAFEAYCMGYLHYHEEHIRGGFRMYNIYFDWAEDEKYVTVYLDPPPKRKRPDLENKLLQEKIFGQITGQGAVMGSTQNSPAPPPGSTVTVSDPPPPKQPPPPPL
jgi:hypothetical protein